MLWKANVTALHHSTPVPKLDAMDEDARELLPLFLESRLADMKVLSDAVERGDDQAAARVGHRLKGAAPSYGFPELGSLGAELETAGHAGDRGRIAELAALISTWLTALTHQLEAQR